MDKYIKADDLIDRIYPVDPENDGSDGCTIVMQNLKLSSQEIEAIVDEIQAADVAPVVRCRDCVYWEDGQKEEHGYCCIEPGIYDISEPDGFCSNGKRRETNG